jgi:hypothetical protein
VNISHEICKLIVNRCVADLKGLNWAKEIKMAKKLLDKFPKIEFWQAVNIDLKPTSLAFFLTSQGESALYREQQRQTLELQKPQTPVLQAEKIGEDKTFQPTKKTLKDFLKYG